MSVLIGEGPPPQKPTAHWFYDGTVCLNFYPDEHVYREVRGDDELDKDGTTTVVHIIDKSNALIPWGCKVAAEKLMLLARDYRTKDGSFYHFDAADFEALVLEAKSAHKERLDEAAEVGKRAHDWIERWIRGERNPDHEDPRVASCCRAALDWMRRHNVRWIHTEHKVYSREFGYAGTMDGLALCDSCDNKLCCPVAFTDRLSLVDWKSSNQLNLEYLLQTAAYVHAYMEEFNCRILDRWIVRMGKEDDAFETWHCEEIDQDRDFEAFVCCLELTRTMNDVKMRVAEVKAKIRAEEKRIAKEKKEATLKIKCKNADEYKGIRKPACNKGNPCETCVAKYKETQELKGAKNS